MRTAVVTVTAFEGTIPAVTVSTTLSRTSLCSGVAVEFDAAKVVTANPSINDL